MYEHIHNENPRKEDREMDKENIEKIIAVNLPNLIKPLIYTSKRFNEFQVG